MPAPARGPAPGLDLTERYGVETPEHVSLQFTLAGLGSRAAAAALDVLFMVLAFALLSLAFDWAGLLSAVGAAAAGWVLALLIFVGAFAFLGYFTLFEGLGDGRTPGKRLLGIRVVLDTGRRITFTAAVLRNILRLADEFFPFAPVLPGALFIFLSKSNKRLGDMAAGTIVVRDRPSEWSPVADAPSEPAPALVETGPPELTEDEFRLLDRFLARLPELSPEAQNRFAGELARRFEARIPRRRPDLQGYLVEVFAEERNRRRSRFGTRARPGDPGRITVTAERFVERKRQAWEAFRVQAALVEHQGVRALAPDEIPGFAARYREIAADLARAHTYGVDPQVAEYLERLVAAGHNALYRARGRDRLPVGRYLLGEFPGAVVGSWRYVLAALLCFMIPAVVGYAVVRGRPAVADEIAPPVMVSRAQAAAERQANGIGYAQTRDEELPVVAAAIISNNINVCFVAFAGGLLAGILTVYSLVFNGLSIGVGFGIFANYGAALYLGTFVAGHGVLELTAIFISGGAGFRLAHAIIAPGDRTRRDALVVEGKMAALMIGAVVTLLAIAGTIEGLLSASDAPAPLKFGVSGLSVLFLFLYLANGRRYQRESAGQASQDGRRLGW